MNIEDPKIVDEKFLSKKCAWLYYVGNLNQNQIAKKIGLSKMRVHRLIAFAEKNGFVKTFVEGGFDKTTKYEEIIKQKYNLKICEVIPNDEVNGDPLQMLGAAGARFIMNQINEKNINEFGIGTGRTMFSVAKWLPKIEKQINVISLNGSLTYNNAIRTRTVMSQISDKIIGECFATGMPLIIETIEQRKIVEKIKFIKDIMNKANNTKIKIFGVGGLDNSAQIVKTKIFSKDTVIRLKQDGAVGEVGGNFFNMDGKLISNEETSKVLAADSNYFNKSMTVLIAGGKNKMKQIKSVLKSELFFGLITDEATAKIIIKNS